MKKRIVITLGQDFLETASRIVQVIDSHDEEAEFFIAADGFLDFDKVLEVFQHAVPRSRIKTWWFYPEVTRSIKKKEDETKVADAFHKWFLGQFEADFILPSGDFSSEEAERKIKEREKAQDQYAYTLDQFRDECREILKSRAIRAEIAYSIADSTLFPKERRLFVDASGVVGRDYVSGVQRVVIAFAVCMKHLLEGRTDVSVHVVYTDLTDSFFHEAVFRDGRFQRQPRETQESIVRFHDGDIFLMPDLFPKNVVNHASYLKRLCDRGVKIYTYVHDIIPIHYPSFFYFTPVFADYLRTAAALSGVIGNSQTTVSFYDGWCKDQHITYPPYFTLDYAYLGSDILNANPSKGLPENYKDMLKIMDSRPSVFMVSTIEPRKRYGKALDAMEKLWSDGKDYNLVIVGRYDTKEEDLVLRILRHPERGKRLFWLWGVSDEYLDLLYAHATGVLFTSLEEGYGLAVVEGAIHGKPLLLRDIPIFHEIAGENALYFKSDDADSLSEAIHAWIGSIQNGTCPDSRKIKYYTWMESTRKLLAIMAPGLLC